MNPKEKARELVDKYTDTLWNLGISINKQSVVKCAIIAVEEILNLSYFTHEPTEEDEFYKHYWQQVKIEIENL